MLPSCFYHIYNHANDPENLFRDDENYHYFLRQWSKYIEPMAETYAYCLMPNHIHFLIRTKDESEIKNLTGLEDLSGLKEKQLQPPDLSGFISKQFSNLFNSYAKAYNKMFDRRGSLFNRPFKAKEIDSDEYLTNVIFYIHHNPVHHGFTKNIADWPHSSFHALISDKQTRINRTAVHDWFGSRDELKKYHQQASKELQRLEMEFT
jgi:putative transposase